MVVKAGKKGSKWETNIVHKKGDNIITDKLLHYSTYRGKAGIVKKNLALAGDTTQTATVAAESATTTETAKQAETSAETKTTQANTKQTEAKQVETKMAETKKATTETKAPETKAVEKAPATEPETIEANPGVGPGL